MTEAVFLCYEVSPGVFAATTRAADRGEAGKIGLPGGKVDPGETLVQALFRECQEEGWQIDGAIDPVPFHTATVEGFTVHWLKTAHARPLSNFKEMQRIRPITASINNILASGYGNDLALAAYK